MDNNFYIRDLPLEDRPYERFKKYGVENLSDVALLAIVVRNGTKKSSALNISEKILKDGGISNLMTYSLETLKEIEGIGEIKAIQLKCICELALRLQKAKIKKQTKFSSAEEIANYARKIIGIKNCEVLKVFYFNNKLFLQNEEDFSSNENSVFVPIKQIVRKAILTCASRVIILHNHPSNSLVPSKDDIKTTQKLKNALETVGITLDDHIIISDCDYYSMRFNNDF